MIYAYSTNTRQFSIYFQGLKFYNLLNSTITGSSSCASFKRKLKVLLRRKFLFLFPSFFNINLLYMFKFIQIAKNWNDTCVRGLEISH